jgi:hypothetical protein
VGSTDYDIGANGSTVYLPGRPHPAVTVVNQGPDTVYLSDTDMPTGGVGYPLRPLSTVLWDQDRALYMATAGSDTANVIVMSNSGAVFDASAIASQILDQGLGTNIAQSISVKGVPLIDAADSIFYGVLVSPGGTGTGGTSGGGGTSSGDTGSGGSSPSVFLAGAAGYGVAEGSFNAWLNSHDLAVAANWSDASVDGQTSCYNIGPGEPFANWTGIMNHAVGGIFAGDSWAQAAAGAYDGRWTTCLQTLKSKWGTRPAQNMHVRFVHEFNGSFSAWAVSDGDASNFVTAYRRFSTLQRQIFPGSKIVWSPNYGTSSMTNIDAAWPGSSYVDLVGPDWYNGYPHQSDAAGFASALSYAPGGNPQGLGAWLSYAASKGKPMCLPETGNPAIDGGGGQGGGDVPAWASAFISWCRSNGGNGAGQLSYAIYFNIGTSGGYAAAFSIYGPDAVQPNTSAVFQSSW